MVTHLGRQKPERLNAGMSSFCLHQIVSLYKSNICRRTLGQPTTHKSNNQKPEQNTSKQSDCCSIFSEISGQWFASRRRRCCSACEGHRLRLATVGDSSIVISGYGGRCSALSGRRAFSNPGWLLEWYRCLVSKIHA